MIKSGAYQRTKILALLGEKGPMTRTELFSHFNVTRTSLNRHVSTLIKKGAIIEDQPLKKKGAPKILRIVDKAKLPLERIEELHRQLDEIEKQLQES